MIGLEPVSLAPFAHPGAFPQPVELAFGRDDDRDAIANGLRHRLDALFRHLLGHGAGRARAAERAAVSLSPLVDQAVEITAGRFRLEVASLSIDGSGDISAQSLVVEAQLFRLEAATPEGTAVLDVTGARLSLTTAEVEAGSGLDVTSRSFELSSFNLFAEADGATLAAEQAVATLVETRIALEAYRTGEADPIIRLIGDA